MYCCNSPGGKSRLSIWAIATISIIPTAVYAVVFTQDRAARNRIKANKNTNNARMKPTSDVRVSKNPNHARVGHNPRAG